MSYTFILIQEVNCFSGYISEVPQVSFRNESKTNLKQQLRGKLKQIIGDEILNAKIKTIVKFP